MTTFPRSQWLLWLPRLLACLGGLTFGLQLFAYARTQTTFVDEGMYLYLGYRFVSGSLSYGDLGAWNYYAPLAYFIPGLVQFLFGPGLETGRYFSVFCALLTALALWILARRLRGDWWAVAVLWALALTPAQIKMYTLGLSQALTACLLGWTLVLVIGEKRSKGQILAAAFLAGVTVMTRHNLAFLIPALVGYVFWQHDRRQAILALAVSILPILIGMALFWPSSLRLWTFFWLPKQWLPFLQHFGPPFGAQPLWSSADLTLAARFSAFFLALCAHFFGLGGALAALLLWPRCWKNPFHKHVAIFLTFFFLASLLLHVWVTLGGTHCIFCLAPYTAFYSSAGLLLLVLILPEWERRPGRARSVSILLFLLLLFLAPAHLDGIGDRLLTLPLPRVSGGLHLGEWSTLWSYLHHWLALDYPVMRKLLPPLYFLGAGILLLVALAGLYALLKRRKGQLPFAFAPFALLFVLGSGFLLSPTLLNSSYRQDQECRQNMFAYYRQLGTDLANVIPAGSRIYWQVQSATPLLYAPEIEIHPAQVYSVYTYRLGGDLQQIETAGYWNAELALQWAEQADFLVLEGEQSYTPVTAEWAAAHGDEPVTVLPPLNPCEYSPRSIFVFRKSP